MAHPGQIGLKINSHIMENYGGCSQALFYLIIKRIFTHGDSKKYEVQINHHKRLHCYLYQSQGLRDAKSVCYPMRGFPVKCCVHRRSDNDERYGTMDVFSGFETNAKGSMVLLYSQMANLNSFK